MVYPIVKWSPDPLLTHYLQSLKKTVNKKRKDNANQLSYYELLLDLVFSEHEDLVGAVTKRNREATLDSKGQPLDEFIDSDPLALNPEHDKAHNYLVKKAYKVAAQLVHPDKGGCVEDFIIVNSAYKTKDLQTLNEFVLVHKLPCYKQIAYWDSELQKANHALQVYKTGPTWSIVKAKAAGKDKEASLLAKKFLHDLLYGQGL